MSSGLVRAEDLYFVLNEQFTLLNFIFLLLKKFFIVDLHLISPLFFFKVLMYML